MRNEEEFESDSERDDPLAPAVARGTPKEGALSPAWISARRDEGGIESLLPDVRKSVAGEIVRVEDAWTKPAESSVEIGTPVNRAIATLLRALPVILLLLPASLAAIWAFDVSAWWILPLWALSGIAAYLAIALWDLQYNSPNATERHRINKAAELRKIELRQAHELRRAIVEACLRYMERH